MLGEQLGQGSLGHAVAGVVEQRHDYVHAEARTPWLKFVDDMKFWVNPERQVIEVRSASRMGRKDFGVNRQRVETLRKAYLAGQANA